MNSIGLATEVNFPKECDNVNDIIDLEEIRVGWPLSIRGYK